MKLYHRTGAASAILANGFQDATGSYMLVGITLSGVWLTSPSTPTRAPRAAIC